VARWQSFKVGSAGWEAGLWFVAMTSFILAAMASARVLLSLFGILGIGALFVVGPFHFFGLWRRFHSVENKSEYAVWASVETLFAVASVSGCVYMVSAS